MVVASTGGHLAEASIIAEHLEIADDSTWVTFENDQSASLLAGRNATYVPYVAPRDVRGTARAYTAISRLLTIEKYHAVLTTGAAVGVSAMLAARRHRLPAAFVESFARFDGPSLTGRIISAVPGVKLLTQHPSWASTRWRHEFSVADRWTPVTLKSYAPSKVFVTVGTINPYRFDRLIDRLIGELPPHVEVRWQVGVTAREDLPYADAYLRDEAFQENLAWADVVVAHAGVGTLLSAFASSTSTVVAPRLRVFDEHVDDHQLQIARALANRGLCVVADAGEVSWADIVAATRLRTHLSD